jgi:hypothetical protein
MAKSTPQKLLIKPGSALWSSDESILDAIGPLPDDVRLCERLDQATVGIVVAHDSASMKQLLVSKKTSLTKPEVLWVVYRKGNKADLNRDKLWPILAEYGMRPITQVAVDETWSALRFRALKDGEAPFAGGRDPG